MKQLALAFLLVSTAASAELKTYRSGCGEDVNPRVHGPVLGLAGSRAEASGLQAMALYRCLFCNKSESDVRKLIGITTTLSESLAPKRGIIRPGFVGAFEAALAERESRG